MYFLSLNPPCAMGVFSGKINGQTTKGLIGLGDNILWGLSSSISPIRRIPFENPLVTKVVRKNNLNTAPISSIFIYLEMYFCQ